MQVGTLYGVGVGPGDPELMTLKAVRVLGFAPVLAYFSKRGGQGRARMIADTHVNPAAVEIPLYYPFTVEISAEEAAYRDPMAEFYNESATQIARHLDSGRDVAVLCEGDPLLYGSFEHLHDRLAQRYATVVVPGVTSVAGCAAVAGLPLVSTNDVFQIIPATLPETVLEERLAMADAAAIIKLGRNFAKVRRTLERLGLAERATFVERGTMESQVYMPLREKRDDQAVYFSLILVPGHRTLKNGHAK